MTGDARGTGTCLRSHHRAGRRSSPTPQPAFPTSSAHGLQQLRCPGLAVTWLPANAGPARGLERSHLRVYSQWASHEMSKPIPRNLPNSPSPHPEALLEAEWTRILAPPLHCQEPRLSHLLCEVREQTQVECFEWCLAPSKSWVQVPGYLPAIIIMSQIAT